MLECEREPIRRHAVRGRRNDSVDMSQAYAKCLVASVVAFLAGGGGWNKGAQACIRQPLLSREDLLLLGPQAHEL